MSKRAHTELSKSTKSVEPINKKYCSTEDNYATTSKTTTNLDFKQKIQLMKAAKLKIDKETPTFSNVEELKKWLAEQPTNKRVKSFNYHGYIIGTIFDTSVNQKWSRI
jgi:hypothetical protein